MGWWGYAKRKEFKTHDAKLVSDEPFHFELDFDDNKVFQYVFLLVTDFDA